MPEQQATKNFFSLAKGLNTESNEINFPDGFTSEERNYELLIDGSRKRRRGLAQETGGAALATGETLTVNTAFTTFKWRGVNGDSAKNFIVQQIGSTLRFTDDADTISTTYHADEVDLMAHLASGNVTEAQVEAEPCQFDSGRGTLFVSSKHLAPFYITYDAVTNEFTANDICITIRDFDGIDDGVANQVTPGGATIDPDHNYNLRNRGWIVADITAFKALAADVFPSKSMQWFRGYRRITNAGFSDLDGIQQFDAAKLEAEQFGQSDAPQGGLFLTPRDTRFSASTTNEGPEVQISALVFTGGGNPLQGGTVQVDTATPHGRVTNDFVTLSGNQMNTSNLFANSVGTLDGFWEITRISDTRFTFELTAGRGLVGAVFPPTLLGQINGNVSLPKTGGVELDVGASTIAYHSGRVFYAGINAQEWSDTIFFSKIAQKPIAYGRCFQEADPTNPEFNALSSSDGGTIVIPNLGNVKRMLSVGNTLLVFSDQGVWEIGGGQRGLFTATGYSVRKITNDECTSPFSPIILGAVAYYTGPRGIFTVSPNQFTGVLESINITEQLIQTKWNSILESRQQVIKTAHDSARKRLYFMYGVTPVGGSLNANHYNETLSLDLRLNAWIPFEYNNSATVGIIDIYTITASDSSDSNKKLKFAVQSVNNIITADLDQTAYLDFDGAESPLPFIIGGWDNLGDFQTRKQAPIITVHSIRTLTGWSAGGSGLDADNDSSTLMTARWDWSDNIVNKKIGSTNEVYRLPRAFQPNAAGPITDAGNDDGYPVYTTRNKVRGRGRVLQLKFEGAATKDSHLLGFSTNYKIKRAP